MNNNRIFERVRQYIFNRYNTSELIEIHNHMVDTDGCGERHIYDMGEFEYIMGDVPSMTLACMVFYGDFCPARSYFFFDGSGNLESTDFPEFDYSEMARWLIDGDSDCGDPDLRAILDGEEDE